MGGIGMCLFVIGFLIAMCGVILIAVSKDKWDFFGILAVLLGGMLMGLYIGTDGEDETPSALDVYRGRTELEITEVVRDTVVIKRDTVVVFIDK